MFITLYFIVTRLPDSLRSIRDHFLSLDPTSFTVDLLEHHLLAAETSAIVVGAALGTPRPPFFEGCSPSPLAPAYASAVATNISGAEDVRAASASVKHRSGTSKGSKGGGGGSESGGGGSGGGGGTGVSGGGGGVVGGGGGGSSGSGGSGGGGTGGGGTGARRGGPGGGQRQQQQCQSETPSHQQLREWLVQRGTSGDFDAILSAMYALSVSAEGGCYQCVPPNSGIAAAALGASESGTLPGTAPAQALHTFTLDSGALRCFFRDSTTLTPLLAPVLVRPADPSGGPGSCPTAALQDAMVTTTTPGGQRVSICTCTRTGRHLATFTRRPGSSLYTLATEPSQVAASAQRRIGLVMEVARTSMIHAASPHFLWPFAVRHAAHQLNLWPCVSLSETSPTLCWTGEVGDASVFWVWRSRTFLCNTSADKLSARAIPCVFLGFVPDAPGWQFYHPTLRRVLPFHDVTFDEPVPFYRSCSLRCVSGRTSP
ncbi:unnamed protein product [Closterium sp. NIES-54]